MSAEDVSKRRAAHWQLYAAVTGSAVAMATGAGAGIQDVTAKTIPNLLTAKRPSQHTARWDSGLSFETEPSGPTQASQSKLPVIAAGGIVPLFSKVSIIQPGEWVSIYGANLASGTAVWNGNFPTSLGGTSVQINGKPAFLSLVSPTQINLQAPDDTARGPVSVVVTTGAGVARSTVTLSQVSPSFLLLDPTHVRALILRPDGSGAYGTGAYDIVGPAGNCLGFYTVPARAGDVVELFGVGLGPTNPAVSAGRAFSGTAPITGALSLYINNVPVSPAFVGLSSAGLYQINLVIPPGLGEGDLFIAATIGGMPTQKGVVFSLRASSSTGPVCVYTGDGGDGGDGGAGDGGSGDGGSGDGGSGDGGSGDGGGGDGGGGDGGGGDGDGGDGG
jgi:uncharacterized protein (TIGR03437 family)